MELDFLQISFLAIIQGLTEFLPISSSAHLILPSIVLGWTDQGLTFDVAVHLGTLLAVVTYFHTDIRRLLIAWCKNLFGGSANEESQLAWLLLIATIPGVLAGLLLNNLVEESARSLPVIATTSLLFALLLFWADRSRAHTRELSDLGWKDALIIGVAQALALIPGTSRSGITITAALFCQMNREAAARFSFLMSIPIILGGGVLRATEFGTEGTQSVQLATLFFATLLSALIAFACIHYFLKLITHIGFVPFVIYRVILGVVLLGYYFSV